MTEFHDDEIARLRMALGRISRQLDRQVSEDGMTRTQLTVLGTIVRRGPMGVSELAEFERLNPTMISRVLAKLEEFGLVTRSAGEDDRRAVRVEATAVGTHTHDRLREERGRVLAEHVACIPAEDVRQLLSALPALELLGEAMIRDRVRA
jgi:DNA-binding MarR family transcriptional regulator